jgi:peptide deformylase
VPIIDGRIVMPLLPEGRVLPVVTAPADVLSTRCSEVDPTDPAVVQLAADLLATQRVSPGCVGLAANQVGIGWRVFSLDVSAHPKARTTHGEYVLVNAVIESATRNEKSREGCMSVPDFTGDVKRASRLTVRGRLPGTGEEVVVETDAFEARALQHEIDHLDGFVFLDRVAGAHAIYPRQTYL